MNRPSSTCCLAGYFTLASIALYVVALFLLGSQTPGFNHHTKIISELGAVGAPFWFLWQTIILIAGIFVLWMSWSLHQVVDGGRSKAGPLLVATTGMGLILGAFFRCDPACVPVTFTGWTHILTSIPATLAAIAGPFVFAKRFEQDSFWKKYATPSRVFGGLSILTVVLAVTLFSYCGMPGIGQRLATFTSMAWFAMLAWGLTRNRYWPPGPSGFQALRYLGFKRNLISFTERCAREYGGITGIQLFGKKFCLISDPLLMERVFVHHASRVKKWDTGQLFDKVLGKGLLTSHGELWKRQRSLIQPAFQPARLADYTDGILNHTRVMLEAFKVDGEIDLHESMMRLSLKIATTALFGADTSKVEALIAEMQDFLMEQFESALSGIPVPSSLPTPGNRRIHKAIAELDRVVQELITQRRKSKPTQDFLGALLAAQNEDGTGMSDQQLRDECMTMLLAGHETTALVLTWALWSIANHPEVAQKLISELSTDAEDHPYLRNVVSESMRLYPVVWAIGRVNLEPLDLGAYILPKGTQIFLVPFLTHRDSKVFQNPLEFYPERWEDPKIHSIPRASYMPFGLGPRKCVGMHFAVRETTLVLTSFLKAYRVEAIQNQQVELQASVTLRPTKGSARVRILKRSV